MRQLALRLALLQSAGGSAKWLKLRENAARPENYIAKLCTDGLILDCCIKHTANFWSWGTKLVLK
jgi:hypothetical protein